MFSFEMVVLGFQVFRQLSNQLNEALVGHIIEFRSNIYS